MTLIFDLMTL